MTCALHSHTLPYLTSSTASRVCSLERRGERSCSAAGTATFAVPVLTLGSTARPTAGLAATRGGSRRHALLIDGGYPRSPRYPRSRRGHEPTCRRRTPAAHCRRPRRRPHRRRPPTRHFCAARASASPPPSHLPPARHRYLSTEMPPLSPSHDSPPSHRRRYRCCPDPGARARVPTLTTTTTVAAPSAPPPPPPSPPRPHTRARHAPRSVTRRTGLQIVLCTQLNSTGLYQSCFRNMCDRLSRQTVPH